MATPQKAAPLQDGRPKFKQAPRYKLMTKAYFASVGIVRGNEVIPAAEVMLNPEEQPFVQQFSGPLKSGENPERHPLVIEFDGIPDYHMEPMNEAAGWMMDHVDELKAEAARQSAKVVTVDGRRRMKTDPIDALTIIGQGAQQMDAGSQTA